MTLLGHFFHQFYQIFLNQIIVLKGFFALQVKPGRVGDDSSFVRLNKLSHFSHNLLIQDVSVNLCIKLGVFDMSLVIPVAYVLWCAVYCFGLSPMSYGVLFTVTVYHLLSSNVPYSIIVFRLLYHVFSIQLLFIYYYLCRVFHSGIFIYYYICKEFHLVPTYQLLSWRESHFVSLCSLLSI